MAHPPSQRRTQTHAGFSLVEAMVVLAVGAILVALSVGSVERLVAREAPRDAALDFSTHLAKARALAMERGVDVWVLIYSQFQHRPSDALTGGSGAYFVLVDPDLTFGSPSCAGPGPCWATLDPTNLASFAGGHGQLLERVYLDDYRRHNARFSRAADLAIVPAPQIPAPFGVTPTSGCEVAGAALCGGASLRAAVVFDGEGSARFVRDDGSVVIYAAHTGQGRSAYFGISGPATQQNYLFAVNGPTGFVGAFPQ